MVVTGGSGFLGGFVIPQLVRLGHPVTAIARTARAASVVADLGATPVLADLDDGAQLVTAFIEAAGQSPPGSPDESDRPPALVNLASLGFGHAPGIIEAAVAADIERSIFVSTTGIFTQLEPASKAVRVAAEDAIATSGLGATIVRPTMIYGGPGDRNMARLLRSIRRFPAMAVPGGGRRLQQPVLVDDLASAIVATLQVDLSVGRAYNVAGPTALSFRDVITTTASVLGRRVAIVPVPLRPLRHGVAQYERHARTPRLKAEQLDRLDEDKAFDIGPAAADLGYAPRSFEAGIRLTAQRCGLI